MSMPDPNDLVFGTSTPSVSFDVGTTVRGEILEMSSSHRRELKFEDGQYKQGDKLYWNDGKVTTKESDRPVYDPVITLQTPDGKRRLFVRNLSSKSPSAEHSQMNAIRSAFRLAHEANGSPKDRRIQKGDFLEITCTGEGKAANRQARPPKLYKAEYWFPQNPPVWAAEVSGASTASDDDDPFDMS